MSDHRVALLVLASVAGVIGAPTVGGAQVPQPAAPQAVAPAAGPQRILFTVVGLSCPFCAYGIEKKLRHNIAGLDSLGLEFKTGTVILEVRDGAAVTDGQLRDVVRKAGFSVQGDITRSPLVAPAGTREAGTHGR